MDGFLCDGCLWRSDLSGTIAPPTHFATTCLHCYCMTCIQQLLKQGRKARADAQMFRCQVPDCSLMVQLNQVKKLSPGIKEAEPLLGIQNFTAKAKLIQKGMRFRRENDEGYIQLLQAELRRKMNIEKKLNAKTAQCEKQIKRLQVDLKQALADKVRNSHPHHSSWKDNNQDSPLTSWSAGASVELLDHKKNPLNNEDKSLLF